MTQRARAVAVGASIVVATAAAFLPALGAGFVFDDHALVEQNATLVGPAWKAWTTTATPDYYPLTWTALWLARRAFGAAPLGYHALNVLLHAGAAVLLWRTLLRLEVPGAGIAGLAFALHPAAVESVAWVSELKNTLSGLLFLAAALAWLRHDAGRRRRWLALATGLFAAACLSKGSVVILPIALAGTVWARRGRLAGRDLLALAPLVAVAAAAGLAGVWFQHHNALAAGALARPWAERLWGAGLALAHYLRAGFFPVGLGFVHDPWPEAPPAPLFLAPAALLAAGGVALALAARRAPGLRPLCLGAAYAALAVLPVLGLVEMSYLRVGPVSNHLQYLALMGPAAVLGWAAAALARRARAYAVGVAALLAILGGVTALRTTDFRDDLRLWTAAVQAAPGNPFARAQLADLLWARGDAAGAQAQLAAAEALERDPVRRTSLRAVQLERAGARREAAAAAREVLGETPDAELRGDAAELLLRVGDAESAEAALRALSAEAPRSSRWTYRHASALWKLGRRDEAIAVLSGFRRAYPGQPEMDRALAMALAASGRRDDALATAAESSGLPRGDPRVEQVLRSWLGQAAGAPHPGAAGPARE